MRGHAYAKVSAELVFSKGFAEWHWAKPFEKNDSCC
jgi:hypothetical protein